MEGLICFNPHLVVNLDVSTTARAMSVMLGRFQSSSSCYARCKLGTYDVLQNHSFNPHPILAG